MQSNDGEGAERILALCESLAEGHRLAAKLCVSDLQLTLTALDVARQIGNAAHFDRAARDATRTVGTVRSVIGRLKLTPPEEERIHDLIAVVETLVEPEEDGT